MYKKLIISFFAILSFMFFVGNAQAMTLSQTSISLNIGQTSVVYANNLSGSLYVSNNSNPNVATVSVNGSNVSIYGVTYGSTTANICDSISGCNIIYITVNGSGTSGTLSLSQTNISVSVGQTSTVTAYNNYGSYGTLYVSSNSNQYVATTSVSGNIISIYGNTVGNTTIMVCQNYNNVSCGTVYVTVSGNYNNPTGSGLNISNLTLSVGSSATISPSNYNYYNYNNNSGLYVSSNSNPGVASATNSSSSNIPGCYGTNLYSVITGQPCNTNIYNPYNTNNNMPGCYGTNLYSITTGQPCNSYNNSQSYYPIPGCYGTNIYSVTTGQLCSGSANMSGSILITALSAGSDVITLCQSSGGSCNTINILVTDNYYATPTNSSYYYGDDPSSTSGVPTIYSTSSAN